MIGIRQNLVAKERYSLKCPNKMTPKYITIHETDNKASANNEIINMIKPQNISSTSFHFAADDIEIVQGIPEDRNSWHCGDGNKGYGNLNSLGIEICYNFHPDRQLYEKSKVNAAKLAAHLMKKHNIPIQNVVQHNKWSGKNCPSVMRKEGKWNDFIEMVQLEFEGDELTVKQYEELKKENELLKKEITEIKLLLTNQNSKPSEWASDSAKWCIENNITDGTKPHQFVTREQDWTMQFRLFKVITKYIDNKLEKIR